MKKKIFLYTFFILLFFSCAIIFLSVNGYETSKFNKIIEKEIQNAEQNIRIKLDKVKIKLDIKKLNLFVSTNNPIISYYELDLPVKNLIIFIDFASILKSKIAINKLEITFNNFKIKNIKKLSVRLKPSNFKSFLLNNISNGNVKGNISFEFDENLKLLDYEASGKIKEVDLEFSKKIIVNKTNFNFFIEKKIIKLESISAIYRGIPINKGNIEIKKKKDITIDGLIHLKLEPKHNIKKAISILAKDNLFSGFNEISGEVINRFNLTLSESLELKNYNYSMGADLNNFILKPEKKITSIFLEKNIEQVFFNKTIIKAEFNKTNKKTISMNGYYKTDYKNKFKKFNLKNNFKKHYSNLDLNIDFDNNINFDLINYQKNNSDIANISAEINIFDNKIILKKLLLKDKKNNFLIKGLEIDKKNNIKKFKEISVKTHTSNIINNNFIILFGEKIIVNGDVFDSTNLLKKINKKSKESLFININKEVQINLKNILTKLSIPIKDFSLIGKIEKGKFTKLSSKSEFSENRYLDISIKKDFNSNKKLLEVYSDVPEVILGEYNFFEGIEGGKLLLTSKFDVDSNETSIEITNFKVKNVPTFAKLLSLADFGGISDLLSGDGLTFEKLEIKIVDNNKILKIDEIFAVGPSISILIDGYIENLSGLISLRGTMVPAKELNKLISKIPLLGDILIPKDIGEGLFGVSFKIKGLPGKIKTTVNPIKTLTPRFITKALEKRKKVK